MTKPDISGIAPFFIVKNVPAALSFYRDRLGFDITFQGPADDIFFGIVQRGAAMILFKDVGVDPLPNAKREPGARWDAYVNVPDPDALAAEFSSRHVEFSEPLKDTEFMSADSKLGFGVAELVVKITTSARGCRQKRQISLRHPPAGAPSFRAQP